MHRFISQIVSCLIATSVAIGAEPTKTAPVKFVAKWGDTALGGPSAMAVDRRSGVVYVLDIGIYAVKKFSTTGQLMATWDLRGGDVQLRRPYGLAVDNRGNLYVTDSADHRIYKFDHYGKNIAVWGSTGSADGQLKSPRGVAVDAYDNVYVGDAENNRIQKFTATGLFLTKWESLGWDKSLIYAPRGIAVNKSGHVYVVGGGSVHKLGIAGELLKTWDFWKYESGQYLGVVNSTLSGIALDESDNFYVTDVINHRVLKFNSEGRLDTVWGWRGRAIGAFNFADFAGIGVDGSGNVYVTDYQNYRVQKFSANGNTLGWWGGFAGEAQLRVPRGIAIDPKGNIYVCDTRNHRVVKFSATGEFLGQWGSFGRENGELQRPTGIAVDNAGTVYVVDGGNSRIQKFSADGKYLDQWGRPTEPPRGYERDHFLSPSDIAIGPSGDVYVASGSKIHRFTSAGRLLREWSVVGSIMNMAVNSRDQVYVSVTRQSLPSIQEADLYRIEIFDRDGLPINSWGSPGLRDADIWALSGIAADAAGNVYVGLNGRIGGRGVRIKKFDPNGRLLFGWGASGSGAGEFRSVPSSMALDSFGNLYVVDSANNRIQKFAFEPETVH